MKRQHRRDRYEKAVAWLFASGVILIIFPAYLGGGAGLYSADLVRYTMIPAILCFAAGLILSAWILLYQRFQQQRHCPNVKVLNKFMTDGQGHIVLLDPPVERSDVRFYTVLDLGNEGKGEFSCTYETFCRLTEGGSGSAIIQGGRLLRFTLHRARV